MSLVQTRWMCHLCRERAIGDTLITGEKRYRMMQGADYAWMHWAGLALVILFVLGRFALPLFIKSRIGGSEQPGEAWVKKPHSEWPLLVLANKPALHGGRMLPVSSGCLVEDLDGDVYGMAPARVLLESEDDGIDKHTVGEFQKTLIQWRMHAGTNRQAGITFTQAFGEPDAAFMSGILLFRVPAGASLPATPLKLRRTPVRNGSKLFVVAAPQSVGGQQQVLTAKVTSAFGPFLNVVLDRTVDCTDISGAPVVDPRGMLAGFVTSIGEEPKKPDGRVRLSVGGSGFFEDELQGEFGGLVR